MRQRVITALSFVFVLVFVLVIVTCYSFAEGKLKATPGCNYIINPTTLKIPASSQTITFVIETSASNCEWLIASNVSWITIIEPEKQPGKGSGQVKITISANTSKDTRTGKITISGYTGTSLEIEQEGTGDCKITISPQSMSYDYSAKTSQQVVVTVSHPLCTWTLSSSAYWLKITSPSNTINSGNATVIYSIEANDTGEKRTGTINIGNSKFTVTQDAMPTMPTCPKSIEADTPTKYESTGGQGIIKVTAHPTCTWRASSSATQWLTISPSSGTGDGLIVYTVAPNTSSSSRSAFVIVGNHRLTVSQEGYAKPPCTIKATPTNVSLDYKASSNNTIDISTNDPSCTWTVSTDANWITITSPGQGYYSGNGTVKFSVSQNTTGSVRTGAIKIVGTSETITVSQASIVVDTFNVGFALDNRSLTWQTGGSYPFFVDTSEFIYGNSSARSGFIGDGQTSWIQTSVVGPGILSFYWKVSSERSFDVFRFTVNGIRYSEISGNTDWQLSTFELPEGSHLLRWSYTKDAVGSSGSDAGWLDKVYFKTPYETVNSLSPLFRFYNTQSGAHFYTASEAERQRILKDYPHMTFEGVAYRVYTNPTPNTTPVYRFFNKDRSAHFYTISEVERDRILILYPHFRYEGIAFYVPTTQGFNERPVYRFFNTTTGSHFYTIDEYEKEFIILHLTHYQYEGIAYFTEP